jgi:hypothetical protein
MRWRFFEQGRRFEYEAKRIERWKNAEEPWIAGFFCYGFADDAVPIKNVDPDKKTNYNGIANLLRIFSWRKIQFSLRFQYA